MSKLLFSTCIQLAALASVLCLACGEDATVEEPTPEAKRRALLDGADCATSGHACTWAGLAGFEGFNGDGQHRLDTKFYWTMDMLFASDGMRWLIDWNNHLVRRVLPDDTIETVIGWVDPVFPGDGAPDERTADGALGTDVKLNHPTDFAERSDGKILVMAWHNHKLRMVDSTTKRVTIACGGGAGYAGDGGPAGMATLRQPKALEYDDAGNLYILDQANLRIRKIDSDGVISTIAGDGTKGSDGDGGPALSAKFGFETGSNPEPSGGLAYRDNKLYVADTLNDRIRVIDLASGIVTAFAGTGVAGFSGDGGPALEAQFNKPHDMEFGPDGSLYIADTDNSRIRAIDLVTGTVRSIAGTGVLGLDEFEGRPATETQLRRPFAIEFDSEGNLYISDTINSRILKVAK